MVQRPEVRYGATAMHHDNQTAFASEEINEELEKGVDGESFVNVFEGIDPESYSQRCEGGPGSDRGSRLTTTTSTSTKEATRCMRP